MTATTAMSPAGHKSMMQAIFEELAKGNGRPFRDAMADDLSWSMIGTGKWSGTYRGKRAIIDELLAPLSAKFSTPYKSTARRIMADGDMVVVECQGNVVTKNGQPYNNTYCFVIRMANGKMAELTEYLDTALVDRVLGTPALDD